MILAQIVTGSSPGLHTEAPSFLTKICTVLLYFKSSQLAVLAIGAAIGFAAGSFRLLLNLFKYRWAFVAMPITLLIAALGSWGVAVKCFTFVGEIGDRTDYWGQTMFFVFAGIPGFLLLLGGIKGSWDMTTFDPPNLNRFASLAALTGNYLIGLGFAYGICNAYIFLVTVWPIWAVTLSLPFFMISPFGGPILKGVLTGSWGLLWATWLPIGLGLLLIFLGPNKKSRF